MQKMYMIEFLRIIFVFFVVLGHCMELFSDVSAGMLNFFDSKEMHTWFGVEYFFIIGGFLLYSKIVKIRENVWEQVKHRWQRLFPALFFCFILCVLSGTCNISRLPDIVALLPGLSLGGEAIGWGDWYVGVYFWVTVLYIGLFCLCPRSAFVIMLGLVYFSLCLKFNAPYPGWDKTYFGVLSANVARGIYSIGIGIAAAFLAEKISLHSNKINYIAFTLLEAACLYVVLHYILHRDKMNFLELEIVFAVLLISISKSAGAISGFFNKISSVSLISRYTYGFFLAHAVIIKFFRQYSTLGLSQYQSSVVIVSGGVLIAVAEYHFFEKKFLPRIKKYFVKE